MGGVFAAAAQAPVTAIATMLSASERDIEEGAPSQPTSPSQTPQAPSIS